MTRVGVECSFDSDGRVRVHRIQFDGKWVSASQGRQWYDEDGRHVLVMFAGDQIEELVLSAGDLIWRLAPRRRHRAV